MDNKLITVTSPLLPNLDDFHEELKKIWDSKWITNNGSYHKQLEAALAEYLGVPYVSLFTNGTLPLLTALQALRITGEVITTPYSFVATTHSIWWNGCKPVFVDIDPATGNVEATTIEEQTHQVCKNLTNVLEAAGTSIGKAVKTVCFLKNMEDFAAFNAVYGKYFTEKPARSCVE